MVISGGWPELVFAGEHDSAALSRAVRRGTLRRLGRGIYTGAVKQDPTTVTRRHLWRILAHEMPGAVIADASVRHGGLAHDGKLFVVHQRRHPLELAGVTVYPRHGPGPLAGDMPLPDGLWMSSTERALLDNLVPSRATIDRTLPRAEVERWLESLLQQRGEAAVNQLRDKAKAIADEASRTDQTRVLDTLIAAALGTHDAAALASPQLRARAAGEPYDQTRLDRFAALAGALRDTPPDVVPAFPQDAPRRALLPFYEAYFSNFIEGTEFSVDEAAGIVFNHELPPGRPADAHDILGTYEIVSDAAQMRHVPHDHEELRHLLTSRHAMLMARRPDTMPGQFKIHANRAGTTEFVSPELVEGTLRHGFALGADLVSPFARAVFLMFLISEVHPFTDGNGRIARAFMNAELDAGGEVRIIIPTVYRANYLSALKAATHTAHYTALIAVLSFARRYTARIDFTSRPTAEHDLARTHAFRDALEAEQAGIRLTLP